MNEEELKQEAEKIKDMLFEGIIKELKSGKDTSDFESSLDTLLCFGLYQMKRTAYEAGQKNITNQ